MPEPDSTRPPRFGIFDVEGRPVALRVEDATEEAMKTMTALKAEGLTQAYIADVPWNQSMDPLEAREVYRAFGAKEGHGITRQAVDVSDLAPRARRPLSKIGRRPLVALIDTAVAPHSWIGPNGRDDAEGDPFWRDARHITDAWDPRDESGSPIDVPEESLDPEATHSGHGTFITGIIRQLAPDATVLSFPVMDSSGIADGELVRSALRWIRDRALAADAGGATDLAVDVVNISFGRYLEPDRVPPEEDATRTLLEELGDLGVRVVTSAGNRGSSLKVLPAAWATTDTPTRAGVKSVGALDPNGKAATYSNHGDWVLAAARGTALVSCLPAFTSVPWPPKPRPAATDLALHEDPNLQLTTFARWAGTSFAAAVVTGTIATRLLAPDPTPEDPDAALPAGTPPLGSHLAVRDRETVVARARAAWSGFPPMPDPVGVGGSAGATGPS
jgi:hypothetical protein